MPKKKSKPTPRKKAKPSDRAAHKKWSARPAFPRDDGVARRVPTGRPHVWQRIVLTPLTLWCGRCGSLKFVTNVIVIVTPDGMGAISAPDAVEPPCELWRVVG